MTTLSKDEVVQLAHEAGCVWLYEPLAQRFAHLCRANLVAEVGRLKDHIKHIGNDALRSENQRLRDALYGFYQNSAPADWPTDIWVNAAAALDMKRGEA